MRTLPTSGAARFSRRCLLRLLAAAAGSARASTDSNAGSLEIDRLWPASIPAGERGVGQNYSVNATILLFSLPVFRRSGVGAARVALREVPDAVGRRLAIEFEARSDPARAHGLDRRGWIREIIVERAGEPVAAATLGLMSESPEQTVDQARRAFRESGLDPRLVAIDSSAVPGLTRSRVLHFLELQAGTPSGSLDWVRRQFGSGDARWKQTRWDSAPSSVPKTFLYALLGALEQPGQPSHSVYVFNEVQYRLQTEGAKDPERGRQFAAAGLIDDPDRVFRVRGRIENLTARAHPVELQIWTDGSSGPACPLRIEFAPRSFLRLAMERLPNTSESSGKEI